MKRPDWRQWLSNRQACRKWHSDYLRKGVLRLTSANWKIYMRKSVHNLDFSNWIYRKHADEIPAAFGSERFFDWVIAGYYYSIYHAALALISTKGLESKSHLATLNSLILHFCHKEKSLDSKDIELVAESLGASLEKEDIELIAISKSLRERASYNASSEFEESLVKATKENAVRFIEKAQGILAA